MAKRKIPGGITVEDFIWIRDCLRGILKEAGARQANVRLNETGEIAPHPFFVGWVGDAELEAARIRKNDPDPGLFRFGDDNYGKIYNETVSDGSGAIKERDWRRRGLGEKSMAAKNLAQEAGVLYQKFIGILVDQGDLRRCIGTLTVGFAHKPNGRNKGRTESVMKKWAQDPRSKLVSFLKNNYELGGPIYPR